MVCHVILLYKNNIGMNAYETPILRTLEHCTYKALQLNHNIVTAMN